MKHLLLAAACALCLPACVTVTGSIDIPGGDGKAPIGTIAFSHTWPRTITNPVITGVTIQGETLTITPEAIKADPIEHPATPPAESLLPL